MICHVHEVLQYANVLVRLPYGNKTSSCSCVRACSPYTTDNHAAQPVLPRFHRRIASHRIALPIHSAGYKVLQGIRSRRRTSTRTALRTQHTRPNLPSPDVYCSIQTDGHHETKLQVHESAPTLVIDTTGRDIKSPTNTQHRHQHQHQQTSTQNGLTRAIDTSKSQILSRNIASQPACSISLSQP